MSKEDVINYVMTTPNNPNKAVLEGMLDDIGGVNVPTPTVEDAGKVLEVGEDGKYVLGEASQSGDIGYECTETSTALIEETVTATKFDESAPSASANLSYLVLIDADEITLTLNETEYVLQRQSAGSDYLYKGQNEFPTVYSSMQYGNSINVYDAGTYSVKIEAPSLSVETTPCFRKAVESIIPSEKVVTFGITQTGQSEWTPSITANDLNNKEDSILVGGYMGDRYYLMGKYDAGMGTVGLIFTNIKVDGSAVLVQTFKFTTSGGSSFESKTLVTQ